MTVMIKLGDQARDERDHNKAGKITAWDEVNKMWRITRYMIKPGQEGMPAEHYRIPVRHVELIPPF